MTTLKKLVAFAVNPGRLPFLLVGVYICLVIFLSANANNVLPDNSTPYMHFTGESGVLAGLVSADTIHYIKLATEGYAPNPGLTGFFPLFPLLMGLLSNLT